MSTITYGSKYSKGVDVAEIAKSVRADIKAAIKAGELPAIKVGVTVSRYAGGRSLRLNVTACPVDIMNPARVLADAANPHAYPTIRETYNEAGREILANLESILDAYNFDGSDRMTDYYHVNFYGHVGFASALEEAQRAAIVGAQ